jgi:two-component system response regulator PilR (NtrC family)
MSPLRARREDIAVLIDHILERLAQRTGCAKPRLERTTLEALYRYDFPGNVRELENILERATALCEDETICVEDLGLAGGTATGPVTPELAAPAIDLSHEGLEDYLARVEREAIMQALEGTRWNRTAAARALGISFRALRYRLEKLGLDVGEEAADAEGQ